MLNYSKCFLCLWRKSDGQGKIYNAGYAGDIVRVTVTWQLSNLLFLYKDIAELNWQPLTDVQNLSKIFEFRGNGLLMELKTFLSYRETSQRASREDRWYYRSFEEPTCQRGVELHAYWLRKGFETALDQGLKGTV